MKRKSKITDLGPVVHYFHHGRIVAVHKKLKGQHREYCLCYSCSNFHPTTKDNCMKANLLYAVDVITDMTTPVWECPDFSLLTEEKQ